MTDLGDSKSMSAVQSEITSASKWRHLVLSDRRLSITLSKS
jgi:hypothetical protein